MPRELRILVAQVDVDALEGLVARARLPDPLMVAGPQRATVADLGDLLLDGDHVLRIAAGPSVQRYDQQDDQHDVRARESRGGHRAAPFRPSEAAARTLYSSHRCQPSAVLT